MYKLHFSFHHIGDQVCCTGIPENLFLATGKRSVITDPKIWAFKHNPFVDFKSDDDTVGIPTLNLIPDCRIQEQAQNYYDGTNSLTIASQNEFMCRSLGIANVNIRHPKLYIYENETVQPDKIVVHTSGSDRTRDGEAAIRFRLGEDSERIMSKEILDTIIRNYRNYKIVQVGGPTDVPLGGHSIDMRGKYDYWQTAKEIATSAKFIGVNSGPMHIANCYPRVEKRIVLMEFPKETIMQYAPGDIRNLLFSWLDPANTYFNKFSHDVGITYSFTNL